MTNARLVILFLGVIVLSSTGGVIYLAASETGIPDVLGPGEDLERHAASDREQSAAQLMEALLPALSSLDGPAVVSVVAWLVITRKLVWYKDLRREEARSERYEEMALKLAGVSEKIVTSVEKAVFDDTTDPVP
jgi:hypothetical protein